MMLDKPLNKQQVACLKSFIKYRERKKSEAAVRMVRFIQIVLFVAIVVAAISNDNLYSVHPFLPALVMFLIGSAFGVVLIYKYSFMYLPLVVKYLDYESIADDLAKTMRRQSHNKAIHRTKPSA